MPRIASLAAALLIAGSAVAQESGALRMGPEGIGPLKRDFTLSDLLALGLPLERAIQPTEGDPFTIYTAKVDDRNRVSLWLFESGEAFRLSTESPGFLTNEGARVGDTLGTLQRLYPEGEISKGAEEGGWLSFLAHGTRAGKGQIMAFTFRHDDIPVDCLADNRGCPDFSDRKSTMVMLTWR